MKFDAPTTVKTEHGSFHGLTLHSAFQPVYSLTHGRLVGHEALLRAIDHTGAAVPPNVVFERLQDDSHRAALDSLAVRQHLKAYGAAGKFDLPEWLLLNVHPASLLSADGGLADIETAILESGIRPARVVIEVLESPIAEDERIFAAIQRLRSLGCLIALDDFGAGHSNFERVFDMQPHIVKLDRKVLLRAKENAKARRILQRMVSLIQECGALVLMEGVETLAGAHITLTCDADLVQGFFFGKPQMHALANDQSCFELRDAWDTFDEKQSRADDRWRESMGHHCDRLQLASISLAAGMEMADACSVFLDAEAASMCYLLDENGQQVGDVVFRDKASRKHLNGVAQFEPLRDCVGARWSRRQYFRRAVSFLGSTQLTRPYMTLQGGWMCLTASIAFDLNGRTAVLCGDLRAVAPFEAP